MSRVVHVASRRDPTLVLTVRMIDILREIAAGRKAHETAQAFGIAEDTVYEYAADLRRRFGAHNDAELVRLAIRHGFIEP